MAWKEAMMGWDGIVVVGRHSLADVVTSSLVMMVTKSCQNCLQKPAAPHSRHFFLVRWAPRSNFQFRYNENARGCGQWPGNPS